MNSIIKSTSLSHSKIMDDLKQDVLNRSDGEQWKDWLESSTGSIMLRWLSAIAVYKSYHLTVNRIESSLETARHETSVTELAFNKGFLIPPTQGALIDLTVTSYQRVIISKGDQVALIGDYSLYALDSYDFTGQQVIKTVAGNKIVENFSYTSLSPFTTKFLQTKQRYIAFELESLYGNNNEIKIQSDIDYLDSITDSFVLRRVTPQGIYLYTGNGILGWYNEDYSEFTYTYISYDSDLEDSLESKPTVTIDAEYDSYCITTKPGYSISKEEVRRTAMYYPIDGRIVQESDYESVIMKYFGGILHDVWGFNSDPNEEVYLLPDTQYNETYQAQIKDLVDKKRELGMQVYYHVVPIAEKIVTVQRSSKAYDNIPNYILDSIDSVYDNNTIYTEYVPKYLGFDRRDFSNRLYWDKTTIKPLYGSQYNIKYKSFGTNWVVPLRVHKNYWTSDLSIKINEFLAKKTYSFLRVEGTISTVEIAIDVTKEFEIPIYPFEEELIDIKKYSYFSSLTATLVSYET